MKLGEPVDEALANLVDALNTAAGSAKWAFVPTPVALQDAAMDVTRLKREAGPALVTQGSSDLIQTLLANDLIDEIRLFTFPILLGRGKKLFGDGAKPSAFTLIDHKVTSKGVIIACYRRAGAVLTGDFAMDPPTAAEIARRERISREA